MLGVDKAFAGGNQNDVARPVPSQPVPFTPGESRMLSSSGSMPELEAVQCGEGEEVVLLMLLLLLVVCLAAAASAEDDQYR